jgi:hypothetical protein
VAKKKDSVVMSRETIIRLKLVCKNSALGAEVPNSKSIMPEIKYTPRMERLLKTGYMLIDKKPVHNILAKDKGIIKSYPKGKALDLMPDWAIFIFERKV